MKPTADSPASVAIAQQVVDVTVNVAGPVAGTAGAAFSYTATIGNNALPNAAGAAFSISVASGAVEVEAECSGSAGATCPATPFSVSNSAVTGVVGSLPHLGVVTITVIGRFGVPSPSSVTTSAHVDPPSGTTDSDLTSNDSAVSTILDQASSDLAVTVTAANDTVGADNPNTYTVTVANNGPSAADGAPMFNESLYGGAGNLLYSGSDVHVLSCTGTSGVECPADLGDSTNTLEPWYSHFGSFPVDAVLTVVYRLTPSPRAEPQCGAPGGTLGTHLKVFPPGGAADPVDGNNEAYVSVNTTPAATACPPPVEADLTVTLSASSESISDSSPTIYTATIVNTGPGAADGFYMFDEALYSGSGRTLYSGSDLSILSCGGTGGAECPAFVQDSANTEAIWNGSVGAFPAAATLTIVYRLTPVPRPDPCGSPTGFLYNHLKVFAAPGTDDPDPADNEVNLPVSTPDPKACPVVETDLSVTVTSKSDTISPAEPNVYTATFTNSGPDPADGALVFATGYYANGAVFSGSDVEIVSCSGQGGVTCPSFLQNQSNTQIFFYGNVGAFPGGAALTIVYQLTPVPRSSPSCEDGSGSLVQDVKVFAPAGATDPNPADNEAAPATPFLCHDISVNQVVTPSQAQAGEPVGFTSRISNATPGDAASVRFEDVLPTGFVFAGANCSAAEPESNCGGDITYDAATRKVSTTIGRLAGSGGSVTITIRGNAGTTPGTYRNTATAGSGTGSEAFYDPNSDSNSSTVSLQLFNTASSISVRKSLSGIGKAGLPTPLTFTGTITCGTQGAKPWQLTISSGSDSGGASPVQFFDGDPCTISEDAPPPAPAGLYYVGPAVVTPSTVGALGPHQELAILSSTTLAEQGSLEIDQSTSAANPHPAELVSFHLVIRNTGTVDATAVTAADAVPAGLTVVSADAGGTVDGQNVLWSGVAVPAGKAAELTVVAQVDSGAPPGTVFNSFGIVNPENFRAVKVLHACVADANRSCAAALLGPPASTTSTASSDPSSGGSSSPTGVTGSGTALPSTSAGGTSTSATTGGTGSITTSALSSASGSTTTTPAAGTAATVGAGGNGSEGGLNSASGDLPSTGAAVGTPVTVGLFLVGIGFLITLAAGRRRRRS